MNSRAGRAFYLTVNLMLGFFFLIVGGFSLALPWSSRLQTIATQFISENRWVPALFGLGFVLIGISIVVYAGFLTRRRYIEIHLKNLLITLDETLVQQYLEAYWQKEFPHSSIFFTVILKKNALQIHADLPFIEPSAQTIFLKKIEEDFRDLFGRQLGYPHDVHFMASFQQNQSLDSHG